MAETLWRAGGKRKAVVAVLDIPEMYCEYGSNEQEQDEVYHLTLQDFLYRICHTSVQDSLLLLFNFIFLVLFFFTKCVTSSSAANS